MKIEISDKLLKDIFSYIQQLINSSNCDILRKTILKGATIMVNENLDENLEENGSFFLAGDEETEELKNLPKKNLSKKKKTLKKMSGKSRKEPKRKIARRKKDIKKGAHSHEQYRDIFDGFITASGVKVKA